MQKDIPEPEFSHEQVADMIIMLAKRYKTNKEDFKFDRRDASEFKSNATKAAFSFECNKPVNVTVRLYTNDIKVYCKGLNGKLQGDYKPWWWHFNLNRKINKARQCLKDIIFDMCEIPSVERALEIADRTMAEAFPEITDILLGAKE